MGLGGILTDCNKLEASVKAGEFNRRKLNQRSHGKSPLNIKPLHEALKASVRQPYAMNEKNGWENWLVIIGSLDHSWTRFVYSSPLLNFQSVNQIGRTGRGEIFQGGGFTFCPFSSSSLILLKNLLIAFFLINHSNKMNGY